MINGLFEFLFVDYVLFFFKLNVFKVLDSVISMIEGMEVFLRGR